MGQPKTSGTLILVDPASGHTIQRETHTCCHCGRMWVTEPGSGKLRGFCTRCNRHTCGRPECDVCVPIEQLLENLENGKPRDHRRILA